MQAATGRAGPAGNEDAEELLWEQWGAEQRAHLHEDLALRMKFWQAVNLVQVLSQAIHDLEMPNIMRVVAEETRDYLIHRFREYGLQASAKLAERTKLPAVYPGQR